MKVAIQNILSSLIVTDFSIAIYVTGFSKVHTFHCKSKAKEIFFAHVNDVDSTDAFMAERLHSSRK